MAGEARASMIDSAVQLLARQGLQATSFSEVLEHSGAPRGSIYHHFPEGKDQLIAAALELTETRLNALLDSWEGLGAIDITERFLGLWRQVLLRSDFQAGCAVLAVTIATDSDDLLGSAAGIFRAWRLRLAELLRKGGLKKAEAARFAATLVAASEGAVVLSRAERSIDAFDAVADQLILDAKRLGA